MANELVSPDELADFPGAPFAASMVDAAVAGIRKDAGWHIAPVRTETVTVDGQGGVLLMLPTMRLESVTEVRDVSDPLAPVVLTDWQRSRSGMLYRPLGWPLGFSVVEVTMTHGYVELPPDLFPVIAERCQRQSVHSAASQMGAGPFSMSVREESDGSNTSPRLAPYVLPVRQ